MNIVITILCTITLFLLVAIECFLMDNDDNEEENINMRRTRSAFPNRMLSDYLQLHVNDSYRTELLNRFLSAKIYYNSEKINLMIVPEMRHYFGNLVPTIDLNSNQHIDNKVTKNNDSNNHNQTRNKYHKIEEFGNRECSLEKLAYQHKIPVPVCPWHWMYIERKDRYPFKRPNAKCNCVNCQAKTIYDSTEDKLSQCTTENVLLPALVRESVDKNGTEKWVFYLEEVPVSCVCSIRLKPFYKH